MNEFLFIIFGRFDINLDLFELLFLINSNDNRKLFIFEPLNYVNFY